MKYGKYSWGQLEAICNKIGGEPVMDGLLGGTIEVIAKAVNSPTPTKTMVTCQVFSGCRCTICGGFFADGGDTVCANGHEVGQQYEK